MKIKDDLLKKLENLKELSVRGVNGEKENATLLLNKLMKKYGFSEEDLEQSQTNVVWVTLKNKAERKICSQIVYAYFDGTGIYKPRGNRTKFWLELTPAQEIEFKYLLSTYLDAFYKEQEIFISAFIQKNQIFPKDGEVTYIDDLSDEERTKTRKMFMMLDGLERVQIRKAIGEQKSN